VEPSTTILTAHGTSRNDPCIGTVAYLV